MNYGIPLLPILLAVVALVGVWMCYFLRIRLVTGIVLTLLINALFGAGLAVLDNTQPHGTGRHLEWQTRLDRDDAPPFVACFLIAANIGIAMVAKLYRAAVLNKVTPAESTPGVEGVRAWLSPLNMISAVCLAGAAAYAFDYSFLSVLFLAICLLLAFPLTNTLLKQPTQPPLPPQAPAEERQRVLALVEAGKITAEDAAELMSALAQSQVASVEASAAISGPRRVMMAGAVVVLLGFFLPWFTINVTQAMTDAMSRMGQNMPQFPEIPGIDGAVHVPVQNAMQTTLHGGDVRNGLGWIALAAAVCVAGLPFFWNTRNGNAIQHRNVTLATLAIGSVAILYLLSGGFNPVTTIEPGFVLAMAGYVVLWTGAVREYVVRRSHASAATQLAL